mgnify:CR=1 FL=1
METLNQLCFNTIQHNNTQQNIYDVLPEHLYNAYVNDLCEQNFQNWSDKIKSFSLVAKFIASFGSKFALWGFTVS